MARGKTFDCLLKFLYIPLNGKIDYTIEYCILFHASVESWSQLLARIAIRVRPGFDLDVTQIGKTMELAQALC